MEDLSSDLNGISVLIVEDEAYIALDLAAGIEQAGGCVVGPVATVREALAIVASRQVEAAILDVNLPDGQVGPVLGLLSARGTTVVLHTGVGLPPDIATLHPELPVFKKPTRPSVLTEYIAKAKVR
jgi:DNA-binding NtrC family response regulator